MIEKSTNAASFRSLLVSLSVIIAFYSLNFILITITANTVYLLKADIRHCLLIGVGLNYCLVSKKLNFN